MLLGYYQTSISIINFWNLEKHSMSKSPNSTFVKHHVKRMSKYTGVLQSVIDNVNSFTFISRKGVKIYFIVDTIKLSSGDQL